ncbi:caspase family protein [Streptomyces sp. TRM 70361]|uniref:HD domain-containing protein n=1 Tax=Streptomyces sp. TRM 70361 TaxID=3116553 RepID=UPI002E7B52C0|nr:caspase family protein [Streptomyces sp. TRM 70361]MEE1938275.1 caspase family protein [Streptomyces sp. TRM 70361]
MARHKALLIGASEYDDPHIGSLPFVPGDLQRLAEALAERGFESAETAESPRGITPNLVNREVGRFLREAGRGDTLLIVLSGHGQHFQGRDYLVPEDAGFDIRPFAESCVEIGWQRELENSPAARVVFLIDACREGLETDTDTMAPPPGVGGWSRRKIEANLRRKVAYVYACSPGQLARFVREKDTVRDGAAPGTEPGASFSLFSRAVRDVVAGHRYALDLGGFEEAVQERMDELRAAYGKPRQDVRVRTDTEKREFGVLPGPTREVRTHPWVGAVETHPAWHRTDPERAAALDAMKEVCTALAARLAEVCERANTALAEDPWYDGELAKRAGDRMGFLLGKVNGAERLSPSEAGLLVLLPLLHQAFWAQEAARRADVPAAYAAGHTPEGDRFRAFVQRYPRLHRRLRRIEQTDRRDGSDGHVLWWLFHRWLLQQPDVYAPPSFKELVGTLTADPEHRERPAWIHDTLAAERLLRFVKDQRTTPFAVPRPGDLEECALIAASTADEHELREPLVACLTKAAQALAVDPVDLPEVVVEHLGISDSVDLAELRTTLRSSQWTPSGVGRVLNAVCGHPAVEIALHDHAGRVDCLLRDISRAASGRTAPLAPLSGLPPYANADRVRLNGSTPEELSAGIRFHLAEDRVQELLMGEELYGDRGLAVRELYQNALDACRHREARTAYLRRTGRELPEWKGLIEFTQGTDEDGRPYLECRDNGVGMGVNELSRTFSQGGARFVDLPEYVEEAAQWAELDPPVELFPNSRFGIGVLSYFMLADEITVHTCRLGRDGRPGRVLRVTIAGPGNLFRIEDRGPGDWAGTRVRLHLTPQAAGTSCVDELLKVLWVASYRTRAVHGSRTHEWVPGELDARAVEYEARGRITPPIPFFPSSHPGLWWTSEEGRLLADGLVLSQQTSGPNPLPPYGAIVDLRGRYRPELTADRRAARSYDASHVAAVLRTAAPLLIDTARPVVTPAWLTEVCQRVPVIADEVAEGAVRANIDWPVGDHELSFGLVGFFPPDRTLLHLLTGEHGAFLENPPWPASLVRTLPEPVLRRRLRTLYSAVDRAGVPRLARATAPSCPALPSDLILLSTDCRETGLAWDRPPFRWIPRSLPGPGALRESGWVALQDLFFWRSPAQPLGPADILRCVQATGHPAAQVVERLGRLGFPVSLPDGMETVTTEDLPLLNVPGSSHQPPDPGVPLSPARISYSAALAGRSPAEAAERLAALGHRVSAGALRTRPWSPEDRRVLAELWQWHEHDDPVEWDREVSTARIVRTAFEARRSVRSVVGLLEEAGFTPSPGAAGVDFLHDDDRVLLGHRPPVDRPVPRFLLALGASRLGCGESEVAQRLRRLGYEVPDRRPEHGRPTGEDIRVFEALVGLHFLRLAEGEVLSAAVFAHLLRQVSASTVPELAGRLRAAGFRLAPDTDFLNRLSKRDLEALANMPYLTRPSRFDPVTPERLYAAALHTHRTMADVAADLARLGLEVRPVPEEFRRDIEQEELLYRSLSSIGLVPAVPAPPGSRISLPALACAAMRARTTFHTAARTATRLGMSHEAEDWFEEPGEETAPVSAQ